VRAPRGVSSIEIPMDEYNKYFLQELTRPNLGSLRSQCISKEGGQEVWKTLRNYSLCLKSLSVCNGLILSFAFSSCNHFLSTQPLHDYPRKQLHYFYHFFTPLNAQLFIPSRAILLMFTMPASFSVSQILFVVETRLCREQRKTGYYYLNDLKVFWV
jgi:hypothetical protein